jgi:four helix bundle protein
MEVNPILAKSFSFALRIVKLSRHVSEKHKEFTLSREILSSGTNIGRYVQAAVSGESRESFVQNMGRALQHADITEYWLRLLLFAEQTSEKESMNRSNVTAKNLLKCSPRSLRRQKPSNCKLGIGKLLIG